MLEVPSYIKNYQKVIDAFGYWPDFHDSPVTRFEVVDDMIYLEAKAWETTDQIDDRGYLVLTKIHIIEFRFDAIISKELDSFQPDNIFDRLGFSTEEEFSKLGVFTVDLDSAMGGDLCGKFMAERGEVTFVKSAID